MTKQIVKTVKKSVKTVAKKAVTVPTAPAIVPIVPTIDPDIEAAPKMIALAAKAAQKKAMTAPSPLHAVLTRSGFEFVKAEAVEGRLASGYTHTDGRAVLVMDDNAWVLQHAVGVRLNGEGATDLVGALNAKAPKPLSAKKQRVADARARGEAGAAALKEKSISATLDTATQVRALAIVLEAETLAAERRAAKIVAATPGMPPNVIRAMEMLENAVGDSFNMQDLRGDKHYGVRLSLLKKLFDRERVLVAETGINNLMQAFYSAVGAAEGKSHAAQAANFADRCKDLLAKYRAARSVATREAKKSVKGARRSVSAQLAVPGTVLPNPKPLNKERQLAKDAEDRKMLAVSLATIEKTAKPNPDIKALTYVAAKHLRLLTHRNGLISLKLERYNSQGALQIWANDKNDVVSGVLTPALASDVKPMKYDLEVIAAAVDNWLTIKYAKTAEMSATLARVKVAISRVTDPVTLTPMTSLPVFTPRDNAADPSIVPGTARLLEDPATSALILFQLEKENSQGALVCYNNGIRIEAVVAPPELLRTLRPVPTGEIDVVKAARQLLNPSVPSVPVTPTAVRHLTAVIDCKSKELTMKPTASVAVASSSRFAAKTPTTSTKSTGKTTAKKSTPVKAAKAKKPVAEKKTTTTAAPRSNGYAGKKIKVLNKEHGARQGTKRQIVMDIILKSKTTDEAIPLIVKAGANNSFIAFAVAKGFVELV